MKITMGYLIKDRDYMLKDQFNYHRSLGVDNFLIYLVNANIQTINKVKSLASESNDIDYRIKNVVEFDEGGQRTDLAHEVAKIYKSDWLICNDEDEFYVVPHNDLKEVFTEAEVTCSNSVQFPKYNTLPICDRPFTSYLDYTYIVVKPFEFPHEVKNKGAVTPQQMALRKVTAKLAYKPADVTRVHAGSHGADMLNQKIYSPIGSFIVHYPYSTKEKAIAEQKQRAKIIVESSKFTQFECWHSRHFYRLMQEPGKLEQFFTDFFDPDKYDVKALINEGIIVNFTNIRDRIEELNRL